MSREGHEQPTHVEIGIAKPEDAEGIVTVKRASWIDTYPDEAQGITKEAIVNWVEKKPFEQDVLAWKESIEEAHADQQTFVAKENGRIVGFCRSLKKDGMNEINALYVAPAETGKGVGSALVEKSFEWFGDDKPVELWVASHNAKAIAFYEGKGFVQAEGTKEHDLGDGMKMTNVRMTRLART